MLSDFEETDVSLTDTRERKKHLLHNAMSDNIIKMETKHSTNKTHPSKQKKLKSHVKQFVENTTAHGYGHVASSQSTFIKIFWIIVIIVCHVIIVIQVVPLIGKFLDKPVLSNVFVKREKDPKFPVIVLCNNNAILNTKLLELQKEIANFYTLNSSNFGDIPITYRTINALADILGNEILEYGHQLDHFVYECEWLGAENCKNRGWISYWDHRYGACFAYNSVDSANVPVKKVRNIGPLNSLRLTLNIEQEKYFANLSRSAGVRLFITNPGTYYQPHEKGISLSPGYEYSVAFRKHQIIRVKNCLDNRKARFYLHGTPFTAKYNSDICGQLCLAELMINECQCVDGPLPRLSNQTKRCSELDASCVHNVTQVFNERGTECEDDCMPSCDETYFLSDISSMNYPLVQEINNYNVTNTSKNLLSLILYFDTLNVRVTKDQFFYNIEDLLSDIGGQLGLFSGYSVLTVIEFIVLSITLVKILSDC